MPRFFIRHPKTHYLKISVEPLTEARPKGPFSGTESWKIAQDSFWVLATVKNQFNHHSNDGENWKRHSLRRVKAVSISLGHIKTTATMRPSGQTRRGCVAPPTVQSHLNPQTAASSHRTLVGSHDNLLLNTIPPEKHNDTAIQSATQLGHSQLRSLASQGLLRLWNEPRGVH